MRQYHILPTNDTTTHTVDPACACQPQTQDEGEQVVYIHKPYKPFLPNHGLDIRHFLVTEGGETIQVK